MKIENNSIIICPSDIKQNLIKSLTKENPFYNVKFLTKGQIIRGFTFEYDDKALYYVHNKLGLSYELCDELLENVTNKKYDSEKVKSLNNLYDELFSHYLLDFNSFFKHLFNNRKVYIIGYSKNDKELNNILVNHNINFEYINNNKENVQHTVYCFDNAEDEINYLFNQIGSLIEKGVDLNNIYIYPVEDEYKKILVKYMNFHNIPMELGENYYLSESPIFKWFISRYEADGSSEEIILEEAINAFNDKYNACNAITEIINQVNTLKISKKEKIELIKYKASIKKLDNIHYRKSIKMTNNTYFEKGDYLFVLGFNLKSFPIIKKDNDYLSDCEKENLGLNTSSDENMINKEKLINLLNSFDKDHLIITFGDRTVNTKNYKSTIIQDLKYEVKNGVIDNRRYSTRLARYECSKEKEEYLLYRHKGKHLNAFSDKELEFKEYDNNFKWEGTPKFEIKKIAYTSLNDYFKCPFMYYLSYMLNVSDFEGNFNSNLGTFVHEILEKNVKNETFDFDDFRQKYEDFFKTNKEKFLVNECRPAIYAMVKFNYDLSKISSFNEIKTEQELNSKLNDVTIEGKIDRLYVNSENKYIAIVDFKTGKEKFDYKKVPYNFSMQLPIYSYLVNENYKDFMLIGLFIQNVFDKSNNRYRGVILNDEEIVKKLDNTYGKDHDGVYVSNKESVSLSNDEIVALGNNAKQSIIDAINSIKSGEFPITQKYIDGKDESCKYCNFKDICFKTNKNKIDLDEKKDTEGADNNE